MIEQIRRPGMKFVSWLPDEYLDKHLLWAKFGKRMIAIPKDGSLPPFAIDGNGNVIRFCCGDEIEPNNQ